MFASERHCTVTSLVWLTPTVFEIQFFTGRPASFEGGQFLSVKIPAGNDGRGCWRPYSFASAPEEAIHGQYRLCIKYLAGGVGSEFMSHLRPGDTFAAMLPYGNLVYEPAPEDRRACFLCTSTGIAPFLSMVLSEAFQSARPAKSQLLYGTRSAEEILYREDFARAGVEMISAISQGQATGPGQYEGRITDYLRSLPPSWHWRDTDFYLCGNTAMVKEAIEILVSGHGVPREAIRAESFGSAIAKPKAA
ncbi:MAG: ferredoxin--NADP reductase [Proteobacteria bacterium]|nr:MAG: ferredoxin--NADP reductase [Pseudomonadota bacterium]